MSSAPGIRWEHRRGVLDLGQARVMGILNVTPDSFSDGGRYPTVTAAWEAALEMERLGAAIVDVGGESTRPGAQPVPLNVELDRVIPVVSALRARSGVLLSVDTTKAAVARAALEAGADIINDVSGLTFEPALASVVAEFGAGLVVMHTTGRPDEMQGRLVAGDPIGAVRSGLAACVEAARARGIPDGRIAIDPGFGFGKSVEQNWELLDRLAELREGRRPVVVGVSRKRMIRARVGDADAAIAHGTTAAHVMALRGGAAVLRAHDVAAAMAAIAVAEGRGGIAA